jgi:8-oxo-dGTP pyrophosphatase MutT (NUDIX family)
MSRDALAALLSRYAKRWPDEKVTVEHISELVRNHADCFERTCVPGHVTASAWIVSPDRQQFLLTHHRKLGRWLQLGGHTDGDPDVAAAALREAREESGMRDFQWLCGEAGRLLENGDRALPIDLDVHRIPARGDEPAHEHHDVRFVLIARDGQRAEKSDESHALGWFGWEALGKAAPGGPDLQEESLLRLGRKARALVDRLTAG